jgi:tRNA 5-methylaminomethyl-2-thiouridine biosynthesis bifunctional protein
MSIFPTSTWYLGSWAETLCEALIKKEPQKGMKKETPWYIPEGILPIKNKKAIIIGAGLAGCCVAYALAEKGWQVKIIDELSEIALGASAVPQAILYPFLSAFSSPLRDFMLLAFLYSQPFYSKCIEAGVLGKLSGLLDLKERSGSLDNWLAQYPKLASIITAEKASALAGISLNRAGIFIPSSGWLQIESLCKYLSNHKNLSLKMNTQVSSITYSNELWHAGGEQAPVLILANGYKSNHFENTAGIPIAAVRGQTTFIKSTLESQQLKIPICERGQVFPAIHAQHICGATYKSGNIPLIEEADDLENMLNLPKGTRWSKAATGHWTGIRAATSDYLPLVGPVPNLEEFRLRFSILAPDPKRYFPLYGSYFPGLFLCSGFGSRGLTSIPLCAEFLARMINQEPKLLPISIAKSLSLARFEIRKIGTKGY